MLFTWRAWHRLIDMTLLCTCGRIPSTSYYYYKLAILRHTQSRMFQDLATCDLNDIYSSTYLDMHNKQLCIKCETARTTFINYLSYLKRSCVLRVLNGSVELNVTCIPVFFTELLLVSGSVQFVVGAVKKNLVFFSIHKMQMLWHLKNQLS